MEVLRSRLQQAEADLSAEKGKYHDATPGTEEQVRLQVQKEKAEGRMRAVEDEMKEMAREHAREVRWAEAVGSRRMGGRAGEMVSWALLLARILRSTRP